MTSVQTWGTPVTGIRIDTTPPSQSHAASRYALPCYNQIRSFGASSTGRRGGYGKESEDNMGLDIASPRCRLCCNAFHRDRTDHDFVDDRTFSGDVTRSILDRRLIAEFVILPIQHERTVWRWPSQGTFYVPFSPPSNRSRSQGWSRESEFQRPRCPSGTARQRTRAHVCGPRREMCLSLRRHNVVAPQLSGFSVSQMDMICCHCV
jgi:hypothetical protein